jgi:hypothetical protein
VTARYGRASDLLGDVLAARTPTPARRSSPAPRDPARGASGDAQSMHTRVRAREGPAARFCWQCRKPLHARSDRCPFCGEGQ